MTTKTMSRLTEIVIYVGLSGYFTAAHMIDFKPGPVRWIALAAFLIVAPALLWRRRQGLASPVDKASTVYLAICFLAFLFWEKGLGVVLSDYPVPALYAVFLLGILLPPLIGGDLFTMFWAKKTTPEPVWGTDVFLTINRHMTLVWAVLFLLSGMVALIPIFNPALNTTLWRLLIGLGGPLIILLGIGAPFNAWYPGFYQRRLGIDPALTQNPLQAQATESTSEPVPEPTPEPAAQPIRSNPATPKEERMSDKPLVVAVNGSPRPDVSNTGMLIEMLRQPLADEGFDLEVINLGEKNIKYCLGDGWCLDKGQCWQRDDMKAILRRILEADAVVLGCPVYIMNVTAQMKTFLDRSLALGHKPRDFWKPGLTVSVSAGMEESWVADYLGKCLRIFGAFSLGSLTALGSGGPGEFIGQEHAVTRAADLAHDLARAVREKRRLPATDQDLKFFHFMGDLIKRSREFMRHDYEHWEKLGIFDNFEGYIQQSMNKNTTNDPALRKAWVKKLMSDQKGESEMSPEKEAPKGAADAASCQQLIQMMPLGFQPQAAGDMKALIQFDISGDEQFTAHLAIADGQASHHEGPAESPDLIVQAPADVWLGISTGKINGQTAFMTGKFKAQGDFGLLMKLHSLFKG